MLHFTVGLFSCHNEKKRFLVDIRKQTLLTFVSSNGIEI